VLVEEQGAEAPGIVAGVGAVIVGITGVVVAHEPVAERPAVLDGDVAGRPMTRSRLAMRRCQGASSSSVSALALSVPYGGFLREGAGRYKRSAIEVLYVAVLADHLLVAWFRNKQSLR